MNEKWDVQISYEKDGVQQEETVTLAVDIDKFLFDIDYDLQEDWLLDVAYEQIEEQYGLTKKENGLKVAIRLKEFRRHVNYLNSLVECPPQTKSHHKK